MQERELLEALSSFVGMVEERSARARARILNDVNGPGDRFEFINHALVSTYDLEALRSKTWRAVVELNQFYDAIFTVIESKRAEGED